MADPSCVFTRRLLLGGTAAGAAFCQAQAQEEALGLWPGVPPGGPGSQGPERVGKGGSLTNISRPLLRLFRPAKPNGTAIVVIAGGGYARIEAGAESTPTCRWLQSRGVTALELVYRLPGENASRDAPLQDGQRAIRLVRSMAQSLAIDPLRIGLIGFSAGGHLAGMTAVLPDRQLYAPVDAIDGQPARPDFCALIYPVLSLMPPFDLTATRRAMIGKHPTPAESAAYSVERQVTGNAPPMYLAQSADDPVSPPDNILLMFGALRAAQIAAEMHMFQSGGHGWALGRPGSEVQAWPESFSRWATQNKFL